MLRVVHPQFSESFGDLVQAPHYTCARSTNRGTASGAPWSCCYLRRFRGNKNRGNITLSEIRKSRRSDILRLFLPYQIYTCWENGQLRWNTKLYKLKTKQVCLSQRGILISQVRIIALIWKTQIIQWFNVYEAHLNNMLLYNLTTISLAQRLLPPL